MLLNYNKEKFLKLCKKYKLTLSIPHGSCARENTTSNSDINIGFLGDSQIIKKNI